MKRKLIACLLVLGIVAVAFLPQASAAPKVLLYKIGLLASPPITGKGMPAVVTASVEFGGACCYAVDAHDITANITLSPGLRMLSGKWDQPVTSDGQKSGWVEAKPGGGLTKVRLTWTVVSDILGKYNATVHVKGYAIQAPNPDEVIEKTQTLVLRVAEGGISEPMYPHPPAVGRDTEILVNATSVSGSVTKVVLNYSVDGRKSWVSVPMAKTTEENDNWVGIIPSQPKQKTVYFYMFSVNSINKTFTTDEFNATVLDYGTINSIEVAGNISLIAGTLSGAFIIAFLYVRSRRLARERKQKGLLCIGQDELVSVSDVSEEIGLKQRQLAKRRKWAIIILAVLAAVLFAIALYEGQFTTIVSRTTNPLGS
jgi:hypothetical protein